MSDVLLLAEDVRQSLLTSIREKRVESFKQLDKEFDALTATGSDVSHLYVKYEMLRQATDCLKAMDLGEFITAEDAASLNEFLEF